MKYIGSGTNKHTSSVELSPEKNIFLGLCWCSQREKDKEAMCDRKQEPHFIYTAGLAR